MFTDPTPLLFAATQGQQSCPEGHLLMHLHHVSSCKTQAQCRLECVQNSVQRGPTLDAAWYKTLPRMLPASLHHGEGLLRGHPHPEGVTAVPLLDQSGVSEQEFLPKWNPGFFKNCHLLYTSTREGTTGEQPWS